MHSSAAHVGSDSEAGLPLAGVAGTAEDAAKPCTATKFHLCVPSKGIARPQSHYHSGGDVTIRDVVFRDIKTTIVSQIRVYISGTK